MIWRPEFVDYGGDERFLLQNSTPTGRVAGLYKSWMIPSTEDYRKVQLSHKEVR